MCVAFGSSQPTELSTFAATAGCGDYKPLLF